MYIGYSQKIWSLCSLLILTFFAGKSSALWSLTDLARVCEYYFLFDTVDTMIPPPEDICTAAATYSEFGKHPPRNQDITHTPKGRLPYVYIYDRMTIGDMETNITKENIDSFIVHLNQLISDHNINVMVFDFTMMTTPSVASSMDALYINIEINIFTYSEDFNNNLKSLFDQMKAKHKDMLFGLKIFKETDINKSVFNPNIYNNSIDFYVVNPNKHVYCEYRGKQSEMDQPPTKEEMSKTIKDLELIGYKKNKLFLTIQILVHSWKNEDQAAPEDWSYSWLCYSKPGGKRKYCRGDLNKFYDQGTVIRDEKLPGVFIQAIDCDDYNGNCLCGNFPAARALYDGLTGANKNTSLINCRTFAILADDR